MRRISECYESVPARERWNCEKNDFYVREAGGSDIVAILFKNNMQVRFMGEYIEVGKDGGQNYRRIKPTKSQF